LAAMGGDARNRPTKNRDDTAPRNFAFSVMASDFHAKLADW
jgi:hypothetical protein